MLSRRRFLTNTAAASAVALSMPHVARAAARTLRIGSVSAETSGNGAAANALSKAVSELTGGSLEIQVFHASSLGKAGELVAGVKDSTIDMLILAVDTMKDVPSPFLALVTPLLFPDKTSARAAFQAKLGGFGLAALEGTGMRGIAFAENGLRHTTAKKPIASPADLAGLRIRVPESPISVATFNALGAQAVPLPFVELIPKMKAGEVDAQENPIGNIVSAKMEGLQTHISLTAHSYSPALIAISEDIWAELTPDEQGALHKAGAAGAAAAYAFNDDSDAKGLDVMRGAGWTVVDTVDRAAFMAKAGAVHEAVSAIVGADALAEIKGLVA